MSPPPQRRSRGPRTPQRAKISTNPGRRGSARAASAAALPEYTAARGHVSGRHVEESWWREGGQVGLSFSNTRRRVSLPGRGLRILLCAYLRIRGTAGEQNAPTTDDTPRCKISCPYRHPMYGVSQLDFHVTRKKETLLSKLCLLEHELPQYDVHRIVLLLLSWAGGEDDALTVSTSASRFPGMMNFCTLVAPSLEISPSGIDPLRRLFDRLRILRDFIFPTPIGIRPVNLTRFFRVWRYVGTSVSA